jgi:two-component system, cell cycle sensor histidine kinase DivJ
LSFAATWLAVIPVEAGLSASRRVIAAASAMAVGAVALLFILGAAQVLPPAPHDAALAASGILSAALYVAGLALGTQSLARVGGRLLAAEQDRYRLLANNMSDVITRHDRYGATSFVSPNAASLFGANPIELVGHGLFDLIHVADRPLFLRTLSEAAAVGAERSAEFRVRRDSGKLVGGGGSLFVWTDIRCRPLDRPGHAVASGPPAVVAVWRDISERKLQEQAVEEARAESKHANAAKNRFLATVTHELRTPLNVIIGFSEMLNNESQVTLNAERRRDYAGLIKESGTHLLAVVNDMLDMSRLENGDFELRPESFSIVAVIESCCDLMALKASEAGLELCVDVRSNFPEVVADKRAIKQILINLLSNAVKYTHRGGRVTVKAWIDGGRFLIVVEDNGIGISEDDLPRLGDPFFQARSSHERRRDGVGLGLSIVKKLAMLHGGEVEIGSRIGQGTRVGVRMPLDCERARRTSKGLPVASQMPPGSHPLETLVKKRA